MNYVECREINVVFVCIFCEFLVFSKGHYTSLAPPIAFQPSVTQTNDRVLPTTPIFSFLQLSLSRYGPGTAPSFLSCLCLGKQATHWGQMDRDNTLRGDLRTSLHRLIIDTKITTL